MPECIVVGGGVIGLLTARALFKSGVDVLLIERGALGGESSWAGGGIVSPLYAWRYSDSVNHLAERSKKIYPQLIAELFEESAIDSELLNSGLFVATETDIDDVLQWGKKWSVTMQAVVNNADIKAFEPAVADDLESGIWMPGIQQVRNPKLVKALKGSFDSQAIPYLENSPVRKILTQAQPSTGNSVTGVQLENETLYADNVIVASGAWTAQFSPTKDSVAVQPVKGQMIMYRGEPDLVKRIVLSEGHYVIPRKDGRILAGSTLEKKGFDKTLSGDALSELHQSASALVPLLDKLSVERQWAGLRPGTENGVPYICRHDEIEGLFIHAGHYRNGIVLGAASAELMADIVLGKEPGLDVRPYSMTASH